MKLRQVSVLGHAFDCLPSYVVIRCTGKGSSVKIAVIDGVRKMLADDKLHRKRIGDFKISVVTIVGEG